jgi:Cysteine dioxygenase type I
MRFHTGCGIVNAARYPLVRQWIPSSNSVGTCEVRNLSRRSSRKVEANLLPLAHLQKCTFFLSYSRLDVASWIPTWAQTSTLWSTTNASLNDNATLTTTNSAAAVGSLPSYTRNLIATDGVSFTLLLLCWNPNCYSPIHNHPGDGCWMRVVSGAIHEVRYTQPSGLDHSQLLQHTTKQLHQLNARDNVQSSSAGSLLVQTHERTLGPNNGVVFIADDLGYHKVGNPSRTIPAMSLHLYSPPPQSCRAWVQEDAVPYQADLTCYHSIVPT